MWLCVEHTRAFFFIWCLSSSLALLLSLPLCVKPAISQVRLEPISSSLVECSSLSLSLPVCLSLEPSISALILCHLTALPTNQALRGNFKCLTRQRNTSWKQMLQCGQVMQDYLIHFKVLTRQFHYWYTSQMARIIVSYTVLPPSFLPLSLSQCMIYIFFFSVYLYFKFSSHWFWCSFWLTCILSCP